MIACTVENNVPANDSYIWLSGSEILGEYPDLKRATMPYHCMHCLAPDCVSACPVGAWTKREDGPVLYDEKKCIGCRYCMNACPFSVPHFDWDKGLFGGALMHKCTMCVQRLEIGQEPACVQTCPTGALKWGDREALIAEAHARIDAHPDRYIDHVYGELENGGTSYLIIAHVPFTELGLPEIGRTPVANISEAAMSMVLPVGLGVGAVLTGVTAGIELKKRRAQGSAEKEAVEADAAGGKK
jgi:formate dehydrogenase iron-sulfur subunit